MKWVEIIDDNSHITRLINLDTVTDIVKISENECHIYFTVAENNNQVFLIASTNYNSLKEKILKY